MSKKSRRRNKKILGLLAAGLGAAALAKRRKANALNAITAGDIADTGTLSGKAGFEGDVPSAPKVDSGTTPVIIPRSKSKIDHGMAYQSSRGAGNYSDHVEAPKRVNGVLIKGRQNLTNTDPTPYLKKKVITTPPEAVTGFKKKKSVLPSWAESAAQNWSYKSGGRVGVGKAKRGFGRALRKK